MIKIINALKVELALKLKYYIKWFWWQDKGHT